MNITVFNEACCSIAIAIANDVSQLLEAEYQCGWFDGGCLTLAVAINESFPCSTEIHHVSRSQSVIDHVVIYVPILNAYFDADGLHTRVELMLKMRNVELCDVQVCAVVKNIENSDIIIYEDIVHVIQERFKLARYDM